MKSRIVTHMVGKIRFALRVAMFLWPILSVGVSVAADNDALKLEQSDVSLPIKDYLLPVKTKYIREYLKDSIFVACKEKATLVGKEGSLGVCTRYDDISGQTDTIIYDSTDEIERPASDRSVIWEKTALSIASKAPFGIAGFDVEKISGHYYRVVFWNDDPKYWRMINSE